MRAHPHFLTREKEKRLGLSENFSPHDAALDGSVSGTDGLSVLDGSFHPGDLGIPNGRVNFREVHQGGMGGDSPVIDDLSVELNFDYLTALRTKAAR
jgi:hypothetical protein